MNYIPKVLLTSLLLPLVACATLTAQDQKPTAEGGMPLIIDVNTSAEQTGGKKLKLIHVATLSDVEGNNEFKRNVAIMQRHQENIRALQHTMQTVQDEELKTKLEAELQKAVDRLNADNKQMVEAYGFSLTRRYEQITEKSHIYMYVTEEEADQAVADIEKPKAESAE